MATALAIFTLIATILGVLVPLASIAANFVTPESTAGKVLHAFALNGRAMQKAVIDSRNALKNGGEVSPETKPRELVNIEKR